MEGGRDRGEGKKEGRENSPGGTESALPGAACREVLGGVLNPN